MSGLYIDDDEFLHVVPFQHFNRLGDHLRLGAWPFDKNGYLSLGQWNLEGIFGACSDKGSALVQGVVWWNLMPEMSCSTMLLVALVVRFGAGHMQICLTAQGKFTDKTLEVCLKFSQNLLEAKGFVWRIVKNLKIRTPTVQISGFLFLECPAFFRYGALARTTLWLSSLKWSWRCCVVPPCDNSSIQVLSVSSCCLTLLTPSMAKFELVDEENVLWFLHLFVWIDFLLMAQSFPRGTMAKRSQLPCEIQGTACW